MAVLQGVQLFPSDSIFNTPVTGMPLHISSATWVTAMGAGGAHLQVSQQLPLTVVGGNQTFVTIHLGTFAAQSDPGPSPIPANAVVEGDSDLHVLVLDTGNSTCYELYHSVLQGDNSWNADQQSIFNMQSNALRTDGWTSADAAGLPMFPLVLRCAEVQGGFINHAVRIVLDSVLCQPNLHIWPARHDNGVTNANNPPFGARMRLKASKDISGFNSFAQVILQGLKKYGAIVSDQGPGGLVITADTDPRWNDYDLSAFSTILTSDFEFIDESSRIVNVNSAQVRTFPMAIPTLVQQGTAASSAASPTSITPALPGNATAGNLLVMCICVTGTTPSVTNPAGWTVIRNNVNNSVCNAIYFLPNCTAIQGPGAVTVGGTSGGAAAAIFEFAGMGATPNNDLGNAQTTAATSTTPSTALSSLAPCISELVLCFLMFQAASITNTNGTTADIVNGNIGAIVSTSGVPNAQISVYWGTSRPGLQTQLNALLGSSVAWFAQIIRFNPVGSTSFANTNVEGNAGQLAGTFYSGMIGG